ncbi:MAG: kelch repeat-containing protein [Bryobacteraceae bacterium]
MTRRTWLATAAAAPLLAQSRRLRVELGPEQVIAPGVPWPYLAQLRDGATILFGHIRWPKGGRYPIHYTAISRDGRKTWTEWKPGPGQGDGPITEGSHVELRDGRLLVFDVHAEHTGNKRFAKSYWVSKDSYRTLEGPFEFSFSMPEADDGGVDDRGEPVNRIYVRRSVIELPGGDLLACAYGRFKADKMPVEYLASMSKHRSMLLRSSDHGKTWRYVSTITSEPAGQEGLGEPVLVQLTKGPNKGRLICLLRAGRENPIYQCESDDEGVTWTRAWPLRWRYSRFGREHEIVGTDPDVVEMSDGTLAMSYGHKPDFEDHGNFVAFSTDHGQTWGEVVRLSSSVTMAYTGLREVRPGELYVVYSVSDAVQSAGYRDAKFTTVGRSVYMGHAAASLEWSVRKPMLRSEAGCAAALLGGELVIAGGTTWEGGSKLFLRDVQIYSPATDAWHKGPDAPEPLAYGPFVQDVAGLEVFGGTDGTKPSRNVWRLDAGKANWSRAGEAPTDFLMARAARVGDTVYVFGGSADAGDFTRASDTVWARNGGAWREIGKLPAGRIVLSAAAVAKDRVYLFGGCVMPAAGQVVNRADAWEFHTGTRQWRRLRDLPVASRGPSAMALNDSTILIFGGYGEGFLSDVWAYDIARDSYERLPSMPTSMIGIDFFRIGDAIVGAGGEDKMRSRSARTLWARLAV